GKTIATAQQKLARSFYLIPASGESTNASAQALFQQERGIDNFNWAGNDQLVISEFDKLVRFSLDGKTRTVLASDPNAFLNSPDTCYAATSSGALEPRYVFFAWAGPSADIGGRSVWRIGLDGSDLKQISTGKSDQNPSCSPDGKWVYFINNNPDRIRRV